MTREPCILLEDVSKFYGDILGVNRISLQIAAGITSLVGPNGSGKSTLMSLVAGLLRPTRGRLQVLGVSPADPESLYRRLGYCTQFDSFPPAMSGYRFLCAYLRVRGFPGAQASELAWTALQKVKLARAADQKIGGYSKGMKQRIKLALALVHDPQVLLLDEPLNGLDPMGRVETIALFQELGAQGRCLVLSSHILHEVDGISDKIVMMDGGYVIAEGDIRSVRGEMPEHPIQILIRCDGPARLASLLFQRNHLVEAKILDDDQTLLVRTRDAADFFRHLGQAILEAEVEVEMVRPADEDVGAVYDYLIGRSNGGQTR